MILRAAWAVSLIVKRNFGRSAATPSCSRRGGTCIIFADRSSSAAASVHTAKIWSCSDLYTSALKTDLTFVNGAFANLVEKVFMMCSVALVNAPAPYPGSRLLPK